MSAPPPIQPPSAAPAPAALPADDADLWLFGYGSLIWKPPPHFDLRLPGFVTGYVRRFWQASEDHRGTPSAPGRVVTLIPYAHWATLEDPHAHLMGDGDGDGETARVWGCAYRIPAAHVAVVREYLDIREVNGYTIDYTSFYPSAPVPSSVSVSAGEVQEGVSGSAAASPLRTLLYIGTPANPQFTGPQDPAELAAHILRSEGPSGRNVEYLLELERALGGLGEGSGDAHVRDLAGRVRGLCGEGGVVGEEEMGRGGRGVHDEEEEVEL